MILTENKYLYLKLQLSCRNIIHNRVTYKNKGISIASSKPLITFIQNLYVSFAVGSVKITKCYE